jgi:hypothetical protein
MENYLDDEDIQLISLSVCQQQIKHQMNLMDLNPKQFEASLQAFYQLPVFTNGRPTSEQLIQYTKINYLSKIRIKHN